jgi:hypothetical protein
MMNKRYRIKLNPAMEVGIHCIHLEVATKTKSWANGPILTDETDFRILSGIERRRILRLAREHNGLEELLEAVEEDELGGLDPVKVRMVMSGCKVSRPYLYVPGTEEFLSEAQLVAYAKEGEPFD